MGARQQRGRESEFIMVRVYRRFGAALAQPVAKFLSGRDIQGVPGIAPEVKSAVGFDVVAWLRQAKKNALPGEIPVVHYRPNGFGESKVDDWPTIMRTADFMKLCVAAGIFSGEEEAYTEAQTIDSQDIY